MKVTSLEGKLEDRRCYLIAGSRQELNTFLQDTSICGQYYFEDDPDKGRASISESDRSKAIAAGAVECRWTEMGDGSKQKAQTKLNDANENNKPEGNKMTETLTVEDSKKLDIANGREAIKYMALDTETDPISYTDPIPDMMCITFAEAGALKGSITTPWESPVSNMVKSWWDQGQHTIGHNMPFDLSILAWDTPTMLHDIFRALDNGQIHDTLIREKLLNITMHGSIEFVEVNGITRRCGYALSDLEQKYLNIDRSDLKKHPDAPRTNYNIYRGIPVAEWAEPFVSYAVDDAVNCGLIFMKQEDERQRCIREIGIDPFATEYFKMKSAWALRLLECAGTRVDPERVIEVTKEFKEEYLSERLTLPLDSMGFRTPPLPAQPFAKGTLNHTDECNALKDDADRKPLRKAKTCGCPVKMKNPEPEHSPTLPRHQYIWNLAGINQDVEAWPAPDCIKKLRKEDAYKTVIDGKAFKREIIMACGIQTGQQEVQTLIDALERNCEGYDTMQTPIPKNIKKDLKDARERLAYIQGLIAQGHQYLLPSDILLTTKEEWAETFTTFDPLLEIWYEREKLKKIVNEYLPKMWYTDEAGNKSPATMLRAAYGPLVLTGRSHSWASKMYPSRSDQTVDPRVRPCTIPHIDGQLIISTDYNGMELGTLAQTCLNLFKASELANKINAGIDTHAYLAAQIAFKMDANFREILLAGKRNDGSVGVGVQNKDEIFDAFWSIKESGAICTSEMFCAIFKKDYFKKKHKELDREVVWKDFFKHYRTMAKPVGLGYPGMLGAATLSSMAKATYGVVMDKTMAEDLKQIWLETYPEMGLYLDYIKKHSIDPNHSPIMEEDDEGKNKKRTYYCYTTPRGMHRAKCGICEAANGTALQAPSAEGALDALYEVQKACWLAPADSFMSQVIPTMFIHDEIVWECPEDNLVNSRVMIIEKIMVECMQLITPGVKAGAESAAMYRWNKYADPVHDDAGNLVAWVPDPEKGE